jgi:hypothetical protein
MSTVYKTDDKFVILFAGTFFMLPLDKCLVTFIEVIRTAEQARGQRLATTFIDDLKECIGAKLATAKPNEYTGAFIFAAQS